MHKLVILIEPLEDGGVLDEAWPEFLHQAEAMPGLRREASGRVERFLFGPRPWERVHELYFDTLEAAEKALASPAGRAAGRLLQTMTGGRMSLFFADVQEDDLENIRKFTRAQGDD